ncbi:MAG: 50S ribosomal protein L25 [Clostridiaceae bacterium]|jgi:large subunit ribosomal protein L25|nr:50S ribosomal protein L25 [Clostridiaceae bacterium]
MSGKATMIIEKREHTNSRASKQLRKIGYVPASISRKGMDSISVKVKQEELLKSLSKHGRNYLFDLELAGHEKITAMVKEMNYSPINRELLSVNFQQISLTEEIKANLDIKLIGKDSVEFKKLLVIQHMDQIPVKGLPQDIPDYIEIDVTNLEADDKITINDVKYPKGIQPDIEADKMVLTINKPKIRATDIESETEEETETL